MTNRPTNRPDFLPRSAPEPTAYVCLGGEWEARYHTSQGLYIVKHDCIGSHHLGISVIKQLPAHRTVVERHRTMRAAVAMVADLLARPDHPAHARRCCCDMCLRAETRPLHGALETLRAAGIEPTSYASHAVACAFPEGFARSLDAGPVWFDVELVFDRVGGSWDPAAWRVVVTALDERVPRRPGAPVAPRPSAEVRGAGGAPDAAALFGAVRAAAARLAGDAAMPMAA